MLSLGMDKHQNFLLGQCGNLNSFFSETRANQTTNMCTPITRTKRKGANTTKTKTNDKAGVSNDLLIDFLVKFVEDNVPASIHGLHQCADKGSAEPTQFSLQVFFSSIGGMSQLSYMQKLKCAMVVSDNLYRILYRLLVNQKRKEKNGLNNSPLE